MGYFKRFIDFITMGSSRPVRRLLAYYAVLLGIAVVLFHFFPAFDSVGAGERIDQLGKAPQLLQDGLTSGAVQAPTAGVTSQLEFAFSTAFVLLSTLALMLPVTWVYMSARSGQGHNQSIVQVLIVMPILVAGVVLVVRNSLALAFSLGGVVAAVRFRTNLSDARDVVFIFLAIAVGFAAGVQLIMVALLLSVFFNFVLVLLWRYDFGRTVLEPTAASQWAEPLGDLAGKDHGGNMVPDRDLILALTPAKVEALHQRFERVREMMGPKGKKPRYDAVVSVMTNQLASAQRHVEGVLESVTKRWKLDEVVSNTGGKPSELYYLVRTRKTVDRAAILTALRAGAPDGIEEIDIEIGDALAREAGEKRQERKRREQVA